MMIKATVTLMNMTRFYNRTKMSKMTSAPMREEIKCEDIFEECVELNLNDYFKDVVEDRPYYDIADLTQAQE